MGEITKTTANITIKKKDGTTAKKTLTNLNPNCTDRQIYYNTRVLYGLTKNEVKKITKTQELDVDYEGGESISVAGQTDFFVDNKLDMTIIGGTDSAKGVAGTIDADFSYASLGAGSDTVIVRGSNNKIDGGKNSDSIYSSGDNNSIYGGDNNDSIYSSGSNNKLYGGAGVDKIYSSGDNNTINSNNATIYSSGSNNKIIGGTSTDSIYSSGSNNKINSTAGNDTISSSGDYNKIDGGANNDTIYSSGDNNTIDGGTYNDTIYSSGSNNSIYGGQNVPTGIIVPGTDKIYSRGSNNSINGGTGNDVIYITDTGSVGSTLIFDTINNGNDTVYGLDTDKDVFYFGVEPAVTVLPAVTGKTSFQYFTRETLAASTIVIADREIDSIKYKVGNDPEIKVYVFNE